jgi:hypothetical protein
MDAWQQYLAYLAVRASIEDLHDESVRPPRRIRSERRPRRRWHRHGDEG